MTSLVPIGEEPGSLDWWRQMLKEELAPYPGRVALVARLLAASTLVMLVIMTFRLPFGAFAGVITFFISRENQQTTLKDVKTTVIAFIIAAAIILVGAMVFVGDPMLRFLWVVSILFTIFFALSTMTNFAAAARFGLLVTVTSSLWDQHTSAEARVTGTLWAVGTIGLASVITAGVEVAFTALKPWDDLLRSLAERLSAVEEALRSYVAHGRFEEGVVEKITRMGVLGTSRLRRVLKRSAHRPHYGEQMGGTVALVGRLVDLTANLASMEIAASEEDRRRMERLADNIAQIRTDLLHQRVPKLAVDSGTGETAASIPLLQEMEQGVAMIPEVFAGCQSLGPFAAPPPGPARPATLLVPDAFHNPAHVKFAAQGCLATSLCYFTYLAVDWPGIAVSVPSCFITALSTIGASRQKQILNICGAISGGAVGMASQVWILPHLDSIAGFTVLFMMVTLVAAWIVTSGPRISYFGVQFAVAFYFINLQEFKIQTSLAVARDRVVAILLGLALMWLMGEGLLGAPSVVAMRQTFIAVLRSLARLVSGPLSNKLEVAIGESFSLRETVNSGLDKVRAFADGVLFELRATRQADLALRTRIVGWTVQLRTLFLTRIALLKYRLQVPGFELPEPIRVAEREFDEHLAAALASMADGLEGKAVLPTESLDISLARLEQAIRGCSAAEVQQIPAPHLQTFVSLSRRMAALTVSLKGAMDNRIH